MAAWLALTIALLLAIATTWLVLAVRARPGAVRRRGPWHWRRGG